MGTWGIARDMAKLNEENLSKLSRKGMYERLKTKGSKSKGKIYKFKKASPEILRAIRAKRAIENQETKKRKMLILFSCSVVAVTIFILIFTLKAF